MNTSEAVPQPELSFHSRPPHFVKTLRIAALFSLIITIASIIAYPFLQPVIPLFYNAAQADKQLAAKFWIFLFPALAWLMTVLHFFILRGMKDLEGSIGRIFSWTTLGLVIIVTLMFIRVVLLVL